MKSDQFPDAFRSSLQSIQRVRTMQGKLRQRLDRCVLGIRKQPVKYLQRLGTPSHAKKRYAAIKRCRCQRRPPYSLLVGLGRNGFETGENFNREFQASQCAVVGSGLEQCYAAEQVSVGREAWDGIVVGGS